MISYFVPNGETLWSMEQFQTRKTIDARFSVTWQTEVARGFMNKSVFQERSLPNSKNIYCLTVWFKMLEIRIKICICSSSRFCTWYSSVFLCCNCIVLWIVSVVLTNRKEYLVSGWIRRSQESQIFSHSFNRLCPVAIKGVRIIIRLSFVSYPIFAPSVSSAS